MMQADFPCISNQSAASNFSQSRNDQAFKAWDPLLVKVNFVIVNDSIPRSPLLKMRIVVCSMAKFPER